MCGAVVKVGGEGDGGEWISIAGELETAGLEAY
jgi:hypothetical protein